MENLASKVKVAITRSDLTDVPPNEELLAAAQAAGWSADPGTGSAIMLPNEEGKASIELHNPMPMAPPVGFEPAVNVEQLIRERVKLEMAILKDDDEIDDIVDAEDFDIPDELPPLDTIYEFIGMEREAPGFEREPSLEDRVRADLDYEELKVKERRVRERRARAEYDRRKAAREEEDRLYGDPPGDSMFRDPGDKRGGGAA